MGEDNDEEIRAVGRSVFRIAASRSRKGASTDGAHLCRRSNVFECAVRARPRQIEGGFRCARRAFDEGTWGQPGERYGPRDLRENSQEYAHDLTEGFYYIDGDRTVLKGKHWVDVGDVIIYPTVAEETDAKITEAVKKILAKHAFPIVLRVDHSITSPLVRAYY